MPDGTRGRAAEAAGAEGPCRARARRCGGWEGGRGELRVQEVRQARTCPPRLPLPPSGSAAPTVAAAAACRHIFLNLSLFCASARRRCRSLLWSRDDVLQHGWGADKRDFSSGAGGGGAAASDDNQCLTNVFVSLACDGDAFEGACAFGIQSVWVAIEGSALTAVLWAVALGTKMTRALLFCPAPRP